MNSGIIPGNAGGAEMNGRHAKGGIHSNSLNDRPPRISHTSTASSSGSMRMDPDR